jgi:two-component system NtrC family response regulator
MMLTVESDIASVVDAVHRGAVNYLVKPVPPPLLKDAIDRALAARSPLFSPAEADEGGIFGRSPAMRSVRRQIALASSCEVNVLVSGDTGTGKELVARAIHRRSARGSGPFVAHNCAATPSDLFESQFFGHCRGAFTGAERDQAGLLEEADGGVLLLDELECLTFLHQAKLLRVMDDGHLRRVGGREERFVSVRYVAATNRDPRRMLDEGSLREDLYYRLCGIEIRLPRLADRPEDVPELAAHFLAGTGVSLSPEAEACLRSRPWPGNVRQLRTVLIASAARAEVGPILPHHLGPNQAYNPALPLPQPTSRASGGTTDPRADSLRDAERRAIEHALAESDGNRSRAARALGIHRTTLRRKLRELENRG